MSCIPARQNPRSSSPRHRSPGVGRYFRKHRRSECGTYTHRHLTPIRGRECTTVNLNSGRRASCEPIQPCEEVDHACVVAAGIVCNARSRSQLKVTPERFVGCAFALPLDLLVLESMPFVLESMPFFLESLPLSLMLLIFEGPRVTGPLNRPGLGDGSEECQGEQGKRCRAEHCSYEGNPSAPRVGRWSHRSVDR